MNAKLFMVAFAALTIVSIAYKISHWKNYKRSNKSMQPLKLIFSRMDIEGAPSNEKRDFMKQNNRITAGTAILLIATLVFTIWDTMA